MGFIPLMHNATTAYITTKSGIRLRWARWETGTPNGKGSVVVLSGRGEYLEKYGETASALNSRGYDVYSFDWRGQGMSSRMLKNPQKGYVQSYDDYLSDLDLFIESVVRPKARQPLVLLAHSMGGHIGLRYLYHHPQRFERAVLTAPLIDIATPKLLGRLLRIYVAAAAAMGLGKTYMPGAGDADLEARRFKNNQLTSDRARFETVTDQLKGCPELVLGGVTHAWLKATFDSIDVICGSGFAAQVQIPMLMVVAGNDTIVSRKAQELLGNRLPNCLLARIDGSRHEILIEVDSLRDRFWCAFDDFTR